MPAGRPIKKAPGEQPAGLMREICWRSSGLASAHWAVTVKENVAACITEPAVAVTVTVVVVGVPGPEDGEPLLDCVVVELFEQPTNTVSTSTTSGSNVIRRPWRSFLLRTSNKSPSEEPLSAIPAPATFMAVAATTAALMVSVELMAPLEETVTGEKLQVAPAGRPEQVNVTAELVENPFCGSTFTVVMPLPPAATVTALGVTDNMKSGAGAPEAGVMAVAWFDGPEVPLESTASTT